jgi:hypothetical protein
MRVRLTSVIGVLALSLLPATTFAIDNTTLFQDGGIIAYNSGGFGNASTTGSILYDLTFKINGTEIDGSCKIGNNNLTGPVAVWDNIKSKPCGTADPTGPFFATSSTIEISDNQGHTGSFVWSSPANIGSDGYWAGPSGGIQYWLLSTTTPPSFENTLTFATNTSLFTPLYTASSSCDQIQGLFSHPICEAFAFLFIPNPTTVLQYSNAQALINQRIPFVYINSFSQLANSFSAATNAMTSYATTTWSYSNGPASTTAVIVSPDQITNRLPLITTIRDFMGYGVYIVFAGWMFTKVLTII